MFNNAIVRKPSRSMVSGLSDANLGIPDYQKACVQHENYVLALQECGLKVSVLDACEEHPDSCFVEDVALITPECAILTNPGALSRRGEVEHIEATVRSFHPKVEQIKPPGTIEAGDVMMVGSHYYIGLSDRSNNVGAEQMIAILERHGMTGSTVKMSEVLHLKTGLSYLENNHLIACGEFLSKPEFKQYNIIEVAAEDAYSANCIWVNGTVLVPSGFPATANAIQNAGYTTRELDVSEFQKIDGGLSCLSLRF